MKVFPKPPTKPPFRNSKELLIYIGLFSVIYSLVSIPLTEFILLRWLGQGPIPMIPFDDWLMSSGQIGLQIAGSLLGAHDYGESLLPIQVAACFMILLPVVFAVWTAFSVTTPPENEVHIAGRKVVENAEHVNSELEGQRKRSGTGISIHPSIKMSLDLESKHAVLVGSTGSGKTTIISYYLQGAINRNDRLIVFDAKPDFTKWLPGEVTLFAPWDKRSVAWDIGADVLDAGHAQTLAANMIPEGKDPVFSSGARQILQAIIIECQKTKPESWDLYDVISILDAETKIQQAVKNNLPYAQQLVADMSSKSTQSLMMTLISHAGNLIMLAEWWAGKPKFSFRRWLKEEGKESACRTLVLAGNDEYRAAATTYIRSILTIAAGMICSPTTPDDPNRKLWFFLDEAPQLGKIPEILQILAVGRSKGVRVVFGMQDISQIREVYSAESAETLASMIGLWIIAQVKGAESPTWFSKLLGDKMLWRYSSTTQREKNSSQTGFSDQWQKVSEPVVSPSELTDTLGPEGDGVRAILYIPGIEFIYRIKWPYHNPKKIRPLIVQQHLSPLTEPTTSSQLAPKLDKHEEGQLPDNSSPDAIVDQIYRNIGNSGGMLDGFDSVSKGTTGK